MVRLNNKTLVYTLAKGDLKQAIFSRRNAAFSDVAIFNVVYLDCVASTLPDKYRKTIFHIRQIHLNKEAHQSK